MLLRIMVSNPAAARFWAQYNPSMDKPAEQDPRVYFAAERTFLAWIRTGLGLMGVGFAVSRFGLFLRELSASNSHHRPLPLVGSDVSLVGRRCNPFRSGAAFSIGPRAAFRIMESGPSLHRCRYPWIVACRPGYRHGPLSNPRSLKEYRDEGC
jgi:hypothetical protein